jgi:hypothetical protein
MTIGKATTLSLGFVGAVAFGTWIGPYLTGSANATAGVATRPPTEIATTPTPQGPAPAPAVARHEPTLPTVPASSVELQRRLKPVLNEGMNLEIAAKGFRDGEEFAAVAHASRNLGVPFMVLKQRVIEGRMSLATAIRELKPDANAAGEANRARIMARADIAAIAL